MDNQRIGSFIAALRKEHGLTQEQLAEKLGVSNRSISRWENGNTLPDFSLLRSLSAVLDVSMSELLNGHRLPENIQAEDSVRLALELAQREGDTRRKVLNRRFGAGLALLVCASPFQRFSEAPAVFYWLCTGLSAASFLAGFWSNNRKNTVISSSVLICADTELRMKTASEMLQFSMKYQSRHKKQHRQAFKALASALQPREYVQFSFIADSCTLDGNPGPWHVSAALTD